MDAADPVAAAAVSAVHEPVLGPEEEATTPDDVHARHVLKLLEARLPPTSPWERLRRDVECVLATVLLLGGVIALAYRLGQAFAG